MNVKLPKKPQDVRGYQINCINYEICPICYACRNYNSRDPECYECMIQGINSKRNANVCNTKLHNAEVINKMITKEKIILKEN